MTLRAQVLAALATVYDPELDEPVTELGFVRSVVVGDGGDVGVRLRLPTPQCAPNFAYLMASDARAAVLGVAGVREADVVLEDHYTGDEINAAVGRDAGFDGAFPGETAGSLDALRELFQRKALVARQARVAEALVAAGDTVEQVVARRVADLPPGIDAERCRLLRSALGMSTGPEAAALVAGDGTPIAVADFDRWRRRARLVSLSLESNGGMCRDLLAVRYGPTPPTHEEVAA